MSNEGNDYQYYLFVDYIINIFNENNLYSCKTEQVNISLDFFHSFPQKSSSVHISRQHFIPSVVSFSDRSFNFIEMFSCTVTLFK